MADGIEQIGRVEVAAGGAADPEAGPHIGPHIGEVERELASLDSLPLAEHLEVFRRLDGVILAELRALERQ